MNADIPRRLHGTLESNLEASEKLLSELTMPFRSLELTQLQARSSGIDSVESQELHLSVAYLLQQ